MFGDIMKNKKIIILILTIVLVLIDQISKILLSNSLSVGESHDIISGFFSITYVKNTGAAWGMFSNGTILLGILSVAFSLFFIKYIIDLKEISKFNLINYSLILAGIFGNMIDRFVRGFVVDFLDFKIFSYDFPVFNIADTFIVLGIIFVMIDILLVGDKSDSKQE